MRGSREYQISISSLGPLDNDKPLSDTEQIDRDDWLTERSGVRSVSKTAEPARPLEHSANEGPAGIDSDAMASR